MATVDAHDLGHHILTQGWFASSLFSMNFLLIYLCVENLTELNQKTIEVFKG